LPILGMNKQVILNSGIIKDPFAAANLQANVNWSLADCIMGGFLLVTLIVILVSIRQKKFKMGVFGIFLGTLITTNSLLVYAAPKIEMYSQDAAVEFYQSLVGKNVYVATLGYKSFVQYFYSNEQPWTNPKCTDLNWLLKGDIDKPTYFACKINSAEGIEKQYPDIKEMYRKNGFVFFERLPSHH
jgi:hypothetical protein